MSLVRLKELCVTDKKLREDFKVVADSSQCDVCNRRLNFYNTFVTITPLATLDGMWCSETCYDKNYNYGDEEINDE